MDNKRVLSFLGLAAKARKLISGEEQVIKGIQNGKVFLAIVSIDASDNTRKKVIDKCQYYDIPYRVAFERDYLGHAIGKNSRVVLGVLDEGFSTQLENLME